MNKFLILFWYGVSRDSIYLPSKNILMKKKYITILFLLVTTYAFAQLQEAHVVDVFPNPFKSKVTVKILKPITAFKVYDVLGKQISTSRNAEQLEKLLLQLKPGIYLLKILKKDGSVETKKVLKQ